MDIAEILKLSPAIPVITLEDIRHAIPLAEALLAGGIRVMEMTLRTNAAFDAITVISKAFPEMIVGAGTLVNPGQFAQAKTAGAGFLVSPGLNTELAAAARRADLPYLPGAATASEIMGARALGFTILKFFPAEPLGGAKAIKQFAPIFRDVLFCPTGGINRSNMDEYLGLKNVIAVGGGWITPKKLLDTQDWHSITLLAKQIRQTHN